jgi:hypothetical protein
MHAVWQRAVDLRSLDLPWLDPAMARRLELAALLHDVGRALDSDNTEPHGFVGARFLDAVGLDDVAPLVAHHSGARIEAVQRHMPDRDLWVCTEPDLLAVLTFLDRTTSPTGERVTLTDVETTSPPATAPTHPQSTGSTPPCPRFTGPSTCSAHRSHDDLFRPPRSRSRRDGWSWLALDRRLIERHGHGCDTGPSPNGA